MIVFTVSTESVTDRDDEPGGVAAVSISGFRTAFTTTAIFKSQRRTK